VKHINHAYHNTYSYKNIWAKRWIDATATTTRAPDRLMRSRRIDGTATTTRAPDRSMPRAKITQITAHMLLTKMSMKKKSLVQAVRLVQIIISESSIS